MLNKTMINDRLDQLIKEHPNSAALIRILKHDIHTGIYDIDRPKGIDPTEQPKPTKERSTT